MYCETTELTYSNQDLGVLNEFGLMCLFGNAHSKALVNGLDTSVEEITDANGNQLYPAYFYTYLKIPETCMLSGFRAWKDVHVGVELKRFGKCYLDSAYILKPGDRGVPTPDDFMHQSFPYMRGNNLFIVDVTEDESVARDLAVPELSRVAALDSVTKKPEAIQRAKRLKKDRTFNKEKSYIFNSGQSIFYPVVPGRDVAVGHAMIFARFTQLMDYAEYQWLTNLLCVALEPSQLMQYQLLEREIFYYDNAYANDVIDIGIKANIIRAADDVTGRRMVIESEYQLYRRSDLKLLALGYARKGVFGEQWDHFESLRENRTETIC